MILIIYLLIFSNYGYYNYEGMSVLSMTMRSRQFSIMHQLTFLWSFQVGNDNSLLYKQNIHYLQNYWEKNCWKMRNVTGQNWKHIYIQIIHLSFNECI